MIRGRPHHVPMTSSPDTITIRRAGPSDLAPLDRLARLDSQRLTPGPHLVAVADDRIIAAGDLHAAPWIAAPSERTEQMVEVLKERPGHITSPAPRHGVPALSLLRGLFPAAPRR